MTDALSADSRAMELIIWLAEQPSDLGSDQFIARLADDLSGPDAAFVSMGLASHAATMLRLLAVERHVSLEQVVANYREVGLLSRLEAEGDDE